MTLIRPSDELRSSRWRRSSSINFCRRDRLIHGIYLPNNEQDVIGKLEAAFQAVVAAEAVDARSRRRKSRPDQCQGPGGSGRRFEALAVINDTELAQWKRARMFSTKSSWSMTSTRTSANRPSMAATGNR